MSTLNRRGILAAAALAGAVAAPTATLEGQVPAEGLATPEDYAAGEFLALTVDHKQMRKVFEENWTPFAIANLTMERDHFAVRDLYREMAADRDGEDMFWKMLGDLEEGRKFYEHVSELIDSARARLLCGAARANKEDGAL